MLGEIFMCRLCFVFLEKKKKKNIGSYIIIVLLNPQIYKLSVFKILFRLICLYSSDIGESYECWKVQQREMKEKNLMFHCFKGCLTVLTKKHWVPETQEYQSHKKKTISETSKSCLSATQWTEEATVFS